jgi:hypothetical protein
MLEELEERAITDDAIEAETIVLKQNKADTTSTSAQLKNTKSSGWKRGFLSSTTVKSSSPSSPIPTATSAINTSSSVEPTIDVNDSPKIKSALYSTNPTPSKPASVQFQTEKSIEKKIETKQSFTGEIVERFP